MTFLLDTNVVSENTRPKPSPEVLAWRRQYSDVDFALSSVTVYELRHGIERKAEGRDKARLAAFFNRLLEAFGERVLPFDREIAEALGGLMARLEKKGRVIGLADGIIAATAHVHNLTLVTRNVADFESTGVRLLNPFE